MRRKTRQIQVREALRLCDEFDRRREPCVRARHRGAGDRTPGHSIAVVPERAGAAFAWSLAGLLAHGSLPFAKRRLMRQPASPAVAYHNACVSLCRTACAAMPTPAAFAR